MLEADRRRLTAGVLRVSKAATVLASALLEGTWGLRLFDGATPRWADDLIWDHNSGAGSVRFSLQRTMLAAGEQGHGLAELAWSTFGYTVALATLARGAVEALARVHWIATAASPDELLVRHASLEFGDLRYPAQQGLDIRNVDPPISVVAYRESIRSFVTERNLQLIKIGPGELATKMLDGIYNEAGVIYSGLAASAHGHTWATGNFFDHEAKALRRDDQMVIEYCAYVTEATIFVCDLLPRVFDADQASIDRWTSVRDQVDASLSIILSRRDVPIAIPD